MEVRFRDLSFWLKVGIIGGITWAFFFAFYFILGLVGA